MFNLNLEELSLPAAQPSVILNCLWCEVNVHLYTGRKYYMSNMKRDHFIAGGHGRLRDALKDEIEKIEKDIKLKYQPELNRAGFFKEIYLKYKMRKEIEREVDKIVPRGGLYLKNK